MCENGFFDIMATGLESMDLAQNTEADFGINFVLFPGSTFPADPYSGGTSLGIVDNASLSGSDPDQEALLNTSIDASGSYTICAILAPESSNADCQPYACKNIEINENPTVSLSGTHTFCPGDCHKIEAVISGGTEPYEVSFTITVGPITFPFTVPAFDVVQQIAICYTDSGIVPSFDPVSNVLSIPTLFTLTASISIEQFVDANGCEPETIDPNFTSIILNDSPDITAVDPYELCDENFDGFEWFDLESLNNELNGGSGIEVIWFEDADGTVLINNPSNYLAENGTVYASLYDEFCPSDTIPIELLIESPLYPGEDAELEICNEENTILDFESAILGDSGGFWDDANGAGVDLSDPTAVDFTGIEAGTYIFSYSFPATDVCPEVEALLTVIVQVPLFPGNDDDISICIGSTVLIDLLDLLGDNAVSWGSWIDLNGTGVDLSDPSQVDFSSLDIGIGCC